VPVAVVTGASRGIGADTAVTLAAQGWDVCVGYRENAHAAGTVVAACRALGRGAHAVQVDVGAEQPIIDLFRAVDAELGTPGALVNNAGIVVPRSRLDEMGVGRLQRIMQVNVVGAFLCAREALLRMSTAHGGAGGVIVNVSSAASRLGSPGEYIDYAASKAAIDTMTIGLAREVATEGVRVNAVRPGLIETEIHASGGQPDRVARLRDTIPMQRPGRPREVAEAIAWLCSSESSYVTGALLDVSGGR
jgi:NAD(P)-dependent dehydrogenase (short-subunit alcohol dehydrogenase family)